MELQKRQDQGQPERKGQKRKLEEEFEEEREISLPPSGEAHQALSCEVSAQVNILNTTFSWREADRAAAKRATHVLAELAKNEEVVNVIVDGGSVPALVKHLQAPPSSDADHDQRPFEHEVEKGSAFALGLLAVKPEHQQLIVDNGALSHLVDLLKRQRDGSNSRAVNSVIRRAADAITNLAHENSTIKTRVRMEGGIPPLVQLLEFADTKVQRASAGALRTLAFKNDENKNQIVECNALPTLILMLRSEDAAIHYEAVGVIGNLVHSSPNIKKEVLLAGALQPVIGLLSSCCSESQREAALLLGQFAATDSDCKVHIAQRGAVRPLIEMLQSADVQLREMSAFALGRLAQDTHNQAGISHNGGLVPLLKLLDSKNGSLQHNAAFALYGLADNEDNVSDFIKVGGVQKLQDGEFIVQATKDCVAKTLKRLEEKIHGRVLSHLLYLMRVSEKAVQRRGSNYGLSRTPSLVSARSFSPLPEIRVSAALVQLSGNALKLTGWDRLLRRRGGAGVKLSAPSAAAADADGVTKPSKSFSERFPVLVTGFFFFMWYFLNVIFNILNKKVYNYFPYPYFVSLIHLLVGVTYCLISWAVGLPKRAPMDKELLLLLTPVAFCHALGHVMSNVSFAAVAVSFTHTIKALEPFFNASASQFVLGHQIPLSLWLSLAPVVIGVSMASLTELSFNWTGFISAMISNIAFTYRSIYSKKAMTGMDSTNVYAYTSIIALLFCIPPAVLIEGPQLMQYGFGDAIAKVGLTKFLSDLFWIGLFYHLYNQLATNTLERVAPLTHAVGNVLKRVFVIGFSIVVFGNKISKQTGIGTAIAIAGVAIYSLIKANMEEQKRKAAATPAS